MAANVCAADGGAHVAGLLEGLETADAFELDSRLREAVALEQRLDAELAPHLLALARSRRHVDLGFRSLEGFARERFGLSPRKLHALLRIERAAETCPLLRETFRSGRISWVQVHCLLPVLPFLPSHTAREAWIELAEQVSVRRLEHAVDAALRSREADPHAFAAAGGLPDLQTCARHTATNAPHHPDESPGTEPETARFFFSAPADVARLFHAVICSTRRHLERATGRTSSTSEALDWMFEHAFEAWGGKDHCVRREHRVFERDGWRCTVPGCSSYRNLHDHHVVFRAHGGSDDLANRTTLCAFHHLRGVHAGRVRCTGAAPENLTFELGVRPGREPLLRFEPGERVESNRSGQSDQGSLFQGRSSGAIPPPTGKN